MEMNLKWEIDKRDYLGHGKCMFNENNSIKKDIENFFITENRKKPNCKFYYLKKQNEFIKKLDPNKPISQIAKGQGDTIFMTNKIQNVQEYVYRRNRFNINDPNKVKITITDIRSDEIIIEPRNFTFEEEKQNKKKIYIAIIIIVIIVFAIVGIIIPFIIHRFYLDNIIEPLKVEETDIMGENYEKEILKANIIYRPGDIYLFKTVEKTILTTEGEKVDPRNSTNNISEYKYYLLMIEKEHKEISNNTILNYYSGVFSQINSTTQNKTHLMLGQSDDNVTNILNKKDDYNLRRTEMTDILDYSSKNGTQPFFKIEFYRNGKIKNIYIPQGYNISNMLKMKSVLNLTIPKLSPELFVDNVDEEFNNTMNKKNEENNFTEDQYNRYLSEEEENNYTSNMNMSFLDTSNSDSDINFDFMESNKINSSENETMNQIKQIKFGNIDNKYAFLTGSNINASIVYIVNEKTGRLESVQQVQQISLSNQTEDDDESGENNDFNENNEIKNEEIMENMTTSSPKIESSSFTINEINNISCSYIENDILIFDKLKKYFNSYKYELFDEEKNNDINLRLLSIKNNLIKDNNLNENDVTIELISNSDYQKLRKLKEEQKYHGLSNFFNSKDTYKYNLMGLNIAQKVYSDIEPSTGKIKNYIDLIIGKVKARINLPEFQTNLNVIIQNVNKLSYKMIELILDTNDKIADKGNSYTEPIKELEKNTAQIITDYDDFSNILREPLNNMYTQVKDFTSDLFENLINLIKNVHQNYTSILNDIKRNKYDIFNEIRSITKNEYINYTLNMIEILNLFHNETLTYIDNLRNELDKINDFQIDILYDIIDSIKESKELFEQYNKRLFLSIEKGIITFRYDLEQYIEKLIGELLYITDFLSINLNKNEILIKSMDEKTRNESVILLKDFRNIVNIIVDLLINDIEDDYELEISDNNENSIKYKSKEKVEKFLENIQEESKQLILEIKKNIDFINQYEMYSNNIDIIENIHNKTLSEFNTDFYNNCIKNIKSIEPNFYKNENAEIFEKKQKLFDIAYKIKTIINDEISDINKYIINFTDNYFKENLFVMHTNIKNFRKSFLDNEMKNLLNQFEIIVNYTMNVLFKKNIKYNFDLGMQYLNEEMNFFRRKSGKWHVYAAQGFINKVNIFLNTFENYLALIQSEEFLSLLENYFYKIRDDILGYIETHLKSIDKYYFDTDLYKNNFFYIEQSMSEIYKISNFIHNYYNELNLDTKIKLNAIQISSEILIDYSNDLTQQFTDLYSRVMRRGTGSPKSHGKDFEFWTWIYPFFGWDKHRWYCAHTSNAYKVINNLNDIDTYFKQESNIIIEAFINKFDIYLQNYIRLSKNVYDSLYDYVENKINNNDNINTFIDIYKDIINNTINNNSNYLLMQKIYNQNKLCSPDSYIDNIEKNIILVKDTYYSLYYLQNKSEFLEYPKEIIPKISEISNQLITQKELIKNRLNILYKNKILEVINIYNRLINDFNEYNIHFMLNTINYSYIMDNYTIIKFEYINQTFDEFNINLNETNDELDNNINSFLGIENGDFILNKENFDNPIKNLYDNYFNFINDFVNEINSSFIKEECEVFASDTICKNVKFKSELNYSEYNFNIIKLRNALYYTKNTITNLYDLFEDFNFNDVLDINMLNLSDKNINDKNILQIYNQTFQKIKIINIETDELLKQGYDYFIEEFSKKFSYEKDYLPFIELFKSILNYTNTYYYNNISLFNNNTYNMLFGIIKKFNDTLYRQLQSIIKEKYDFYNINKTNFEDIFTQYNNLIQKSFDFNQNYILNLNNSYNFKNVIKNAIWFFIEKKIKFFSDNINEFAEKYELKFFNYSFNLGDYTGEYMKKNYLDYIFKYVYDYVELYENYTDIYIDYLLNDISILRKNITFQIKDIYNTFYDKLKRNISEFLTYDYINELNNNKSFCSNYSMDKIEEYKNEDKINYEKYINYTILLQNITNSTNYTDYITEDIEEVIFINKTNNLLICHENKYYNYKVKIIEDFDEIYKNDLEINIQNLTSIIERRIIDETYLYYFLLDEINFEEYNLILDDISIVFDDIKDLNFYIDNIKEKDYRNELENSLFINYKNSYTKYINDYILNNILSNIDILINERIMIQINFIKNKILGDFDYFKLILNDTNLIGTTTKKAFNQLYENLKQKINSIINEEIENILYDNLNLFYKKNSKLFRNNFLNYYVNNNNKNVSIYKFNEFIYDIMKEISFNKTLDEITNSIFDSIIIETIKNRINDTLYKNIENFFIIIDDIKIEMNNILNNIQDKEVPNDMNNTVNLIDEYNELVKSQNTKFIFIVSEKPFQIISVFIEDYLEPPLIEIKNQYNSIEIELLNKISDILGNFPDYSEIVKNNLNLESKVANISENRDILKNYLSEYFIYFMNEINKYFNELAYLTIINESYYMESKCNLSMCHLNSTLEQELNNSEILGNTERRLEENEKINISKYFRNIPRLNKSNIHYKTTYRNSRPDSINVNSDSPALSKDDTIYFYQFINNSLNDFQQEILSNEFMDVNVTHKKEINKLNNIILPKIKISVDFSTLKFSTIFTKDNFNILTDKINYHYNKIYDYVSKNYTEIISNYMNQFLNSLNNTSTFMNVTSNIGFNIIMEMLDGLQQLINEKLSLVDNTLINNLIPIEELYKMINDTINNINYTQLLNNLENQFDKALEVLNKIEQDVKSPIITALDMISFINNTNFVEILNDYIGYNNYDFLLWIGFQAQEGEANTLINLLSFDMYINQMEINFPKMELIPLFEVRPIIYIYSASIHLDLSLNLVYRDNNKNLLDMKEVQILSHIRINLITRAHCEMGIYFPIGIGEIYMALGLNGLLADVSVKTGIIINILKNNYILDLQFGLFFVGFDFFLKVGIYIDLGIFSFRINFYIFYYLIPLLMPIEANFYKMYSFRNKALESSGSARLQLFGLIPISLGFIPKLIDEKLFTKYIG